MLVWNLNVLAKNSRKKLKRERYCSYGHKNLGSLVKAARLFNQEMLNLLVKRGFDKYNRLENRFALNVSVSDSILE